MQANHYSPVMPKLTKHWLGVYKQEELVGVITLGWGTRPLHTIQKILGPDFESKDYYEIGKMCMLDSEPKNSETQMISQVVRWIKNNCPEVKFLYTLADGIMGKCGYVYQAANFYYGGEYWTDSYISSKGEKVHPRTTRHLCRDNWLWHYDERTVGSTKNLKKIMIEKVALASANNTKPPKEQVFWLTPEFMNHIGMKKVKGKMFRHISLEQEGKKTAKEKVQKSIGRLGTGVYPKADNGALQWKQMVGRKKYEILPGSMPEWNLQVVEHNKKMLMLIKKKLKSA